MEHPVLRLGLIGFKPEEVTRVAGWLAREQDGWPLWSLAPYDKADGWWIACRSISEIAGDHLTIQTGHPSQPWLRLSPLELDRPIAFSGKLPSGMESDSAVNIVDEASVRQHLQRFEAWLRPLRGQFALGADLVERQAELQAGVYQVALQGRLLAIIDLHHWRAGILPTARPVDFAQAVWEKRPTAANSIPEKFIQMSISQLMWIYASRTRKDVLPPRYRRQKIYFRRLPRLPVGWLHDEDLLLLRAITAREATLDELAQRTGMGASMITRYVAALYYAGALTTNPRSAGRLETRRSPLGPESSQPLRRLPGHEFPVSTAEISGFSQATSRYLTEQDLTAPAPMPIQ